jgi:hypothetical protein
LSAMCGLLVGKALGSLVPFRLWAAPRPVWSDRIRMYSAEQSGRGRSPTHGPVGACQRIEAGGGAARSAARTWPRWRRRGSRGACLLTGHGRDVGRNTKQKDRRAGIDAAARAASIPWSSLGSLLIPARSRGLSIILGEDAWQPGVGRRGLDHATAIIVNAKSSRSIDY